MGCRPSRASLGRVGDSSWEYNKHFIKEQKEKKLKNKKCGRGGRRKAPVYNDFSSTSKTYTNLNSKSSRITVRLSTDGSTLEIEQYDIDLNACVNRYRADVAAATQNQARSSHQTSIYPVPGLQGMKHSYSAPQLSYIAPIENVYKTREGNNATNVQHIGNTVVSKPKKSKSASERGFLPKSNGWCDRKHDVTYDVIQHNQTHKTKAIVNSVNMNSCHSTFCDSDISVVDIENTHGLADTIRSAKRSGSRLKLKRVCENDSTSACSNHTGVFKHHKSELENPCCSFMTGAAVNSHSINCKGSMFETLGATDMCQCSKHSVNNIDKYPDVAYQKNNSETGSHGTDFHSSQPVQKTCKHGIPCSGVKSFDNDVIQANSLQNQKHFVTADENSNLNETVVCECYTGLPTRNINMSSLGCLDSVDSESMKRLISDIDFSRRRFVLPTQLTNGFENGDIYSSVVQTLDPQSIHSAHDSELSPNIEDTTVFSRCHSVGGGTRQYEADDTTSCSKFTNLRNNLVSIETADKLMGLTEGTNYRSGASSDFVFLMQTTTADCRLDEMDSDVSKSSAADVCNRPTYITMIIRNNIGKLLGKNVVCCTGVKKPRKDMNIYFEDDTSLCDETQEYFQTTGNGNVCKNVTSADDREDTTPEFEESLDESFEKRFDFSMCSRVIQTSSSPNGARDDADEDDASSSDFDDDEFLDALESTYV